MYRYLTKLYIILALTTVVEARKYYKRQNTWSSAGENDVTTLYARSKLHCASFLEEGDVGFAFDQSDHTCHLLHCVNPNVTDVSVEMSNIHLYLKYPPITNFLLARGKPASMSSVFSDDGIYTYDGGKALDGIYLPDGIVEEASIASSANEENNPWWRVDLEQVYCVLGVNILNRAYFDQVWRDKNKDAEVTVSRDETQLSYDTNPDSRCNYFDGPLNQYYTLITCIQPMRGQFVQIQYRPSAESLINLYEIEVFGV